MFQAGDLYPTYDPFSSTEVFFTETDRDALRFDSKSKVQVLDEVVIKEGPDMGKGATVILIDGPNAVIKLDKDGKTYQEVKYVKLDTLAKALEAEDEGVSGSKGRVGGGFGGKGNDKGPGMAGKKAAPKG